MRHLSVMLLLSFAPLAACGDDSSFAATDAGGDGVRDGTVRDAVAPIDAEEADTGDGSDGGGDGGSTPSCELVASEPVTASADGQVIENLRISADGEPAIRVDGFSGVVIRNVEIEHTGSRGIHFANADDITIENVSIEHVGAPETGPNPSDGANNIECYSSERPIIRNARLTRGSSGIYLVECPGSELRFIEGHDFRGPFPRGQLVQWNRSSDGLLEDFSVVQPPGSWPEDNVNVYQSTNVVIRRGHIDGNNSPSGVGVIFDGDTGAGLVEDVDAIRMGNGCFSAYAGADGSIFRRTRCRENICEDQGRGLPSSNALMWAGNPTGGGFRIESSAHWASCNGNILWPSDSFVVAELDEIDFTMRPRIESDFCWEP